MKNRAKVFSIHEESILLLAKLPELQKSPRKNIFDILKIQHREVLNSNILAYFFDPNEEHGFGSLFMESLQEIAAKKIEDLKISHNNIFFNDIGSFGGIVAVRTEEQTRGADNQNKSIDIVLEGDDWVIGIENKIHHHLENPLNTYWDHLKSKKDFPFGILLTLFPYNVGQGKLNDGNYFLNLTHKELLEGVQRNLQLTGEVSSTDLFYIREYFKNIESYYFHLKHNPKMDILVQEVIENYDTISKILEKKEAAENYIERQIFDAFVSLGYEKTGNWFRRKDKRFDLYFYVQKASELMSKNHLWLCFEIRDQTNQTIERSAFIEHFRKEFSGLENFLQDELIISGPRTHAFIYKEVEIFHKDSSFELKLKEVLNRLIEEPDAPVRKVEEYLVERNHFKDR